MSRSVEGASRPARFSFVARDRAIHVVAVLRDEDLSLLAVLSTQGFLVERATSETLERAALSPTVEALVLDTELTPAMQALSRLRRSSGVASTLPVVLLGPAGSASAVSIALDVGGDVFVPRPADPEELLTALRTLLELPILAGVGLAKGPPELPAQEPQGPLEPPLATERPPPPSEPAEAVTLPAELSPALAGLLRAAALRSGQDGDLQLPPIDDVSVDELVPPELLEPLDTPLEPLLEEAPSTLTPPAGSLLGSSPAPPRRSQSRLFAAVNAGSSRPAPTPTITPLPVLGEMRLSGSLGEWGVGVLLGAAARARASGLVVLRSQGVEYELALTSAHLLAVRSSRAADEIGPLLVRLGALPREAARFAAVPLDAGLRGAGMLASQGYLSAEALAQAISRAARELTYDLLCLRSLEWEMRPLESAAEIPLSPRPLEALLVLGARARIEPEAALAALGGAEALLTVRAEPPALNALPLQRAELELLLQASRGRRLGELLEGPRFSLAATVLALQWLGFVRLEGGARGAMPGLMTGAVAQERTRIRALAEAAEANDYFALLGVSEWATRIAAREALAARMNECDGLRGRHPDATGLARVFACLEALSALLEDVPAWERYCSGLRVRTT